MGEIKGNPAGRAKAKASMGRDDRGKGKAVAMVTFPPAPGKKKLEGPGGKGQLLPHAKPKTLSSVIKSVEVKEKTSVSSSTQTFTKTTKTTTAATVKANKVYTSSTQTFTKTTKTTTAATVKANKVYTLHGQKSDPHERLGGKGQLHRPHAKLKTQSVFFQSVEVIL